jgi:MFS family permease
LNGSAIESFWAGTSFLLASATFQPFIGALSDIFGRRGLLLGCIFLFALGSLLACLAHEFRLLLAGRTLQGIGGGGIIVLVLVICTDIIPLRQRPQFTSYVQIPWGVGTVSGPLIGAAFAEKVTWRWMYGKPPRNLFLHVLIYLQFLY